MKKFFLLISLGLLVALVGCNTETTTEEESTTTTVTTSTSTTTTTNQTTTTTTTEVDILKPTFYGVLNKTITVGDAFDPMEGVTAVDTVDGDLTDQIEVSGDYNVNEVGSYIIYYTVSDSSGNERIKGRTLIVKLPDVAGRLLNPNFDDEMEYWGVWSGEGGLGSGSVVDGVAQIVIEQIGSANYHVQFEQKDLTIEEGKFYEITFEAKADDARPIGVLMEDPNNGYHKYGNEIIEVTTTWQTFTLEVAVDTGTINTAKLGFMLGNVDEGVNSKPTTVYLDNFTMTEVDPPEDAEDPVIHGANDVTIELDATFDPLEGISVTDDLDFDLSVEDVIVEGDKISTDDDGNYVFDSSAEGEFTLTYKVTDESGKEGTATRVITVASLVFVDTNNVGNSDFETDEEIEFNDVEGATGWVAWYQKGWGTDAQVTYTLNDNGELEIATTYLGSENFSWTIQLQQSGITLEKGKTYKMVFDAKATVDRTIKAYIKTQGDNPYTTKDVSLTATMNTFEHVFTVVDNTDTNMIIGFEMGRFGSTPEEAVITLDNIKLLTLDEPELIENGDFSDFGFEPWFGNADWAGWANATYEIVDGVMVIDVISVGNQPWAVQFNALDLALENGKTYKLTFDIYADVDRYLEVKAEDSSADGGWHVSQINATTQVQNLEFVFTYGSDAASRINFEMGYFADVDDNGTPDDTSDDVTTVKSANGKIFLDNLKLEVQDETDDTVYTDTGLIKNGTFDQAVGWDSWWGDQWSGESTGTAEVVNGELVVDITQHGNAVYATQVVQTELTIRMGRTYIIELDIKADNDRPMNVQLGEPLTSGDYFNEFMDAYRVDVTTESQHVKIQFTMDQATNENGKLVFELGNFASDNGTPDDTSDDIPATATGKVYIDNVYIYPTFNPVEE